MHNYMNIFGLTVHCNHSYDFATKIFKILEIVLDIIFCNHCCNLFSVWYGPVTLKNLPKQKEKTDSL